MSPAALAIKFQLVTGTTGTTGTPTRHWNAVKWSKAPIQSTILGYSNSEQHCFERKLKKIELMWLLAL